MEFRRVLKGGGRLALLEPLHAWHRRDPNVLGGVEITPIRPLIDALRATQHDAPSMTDFTAQDLFQWAVDAGFSEARLQLEAVRRRAPRISWDAFYRTAPNPHARTLEELASSTLSRKERDKLEAYLRPRVERRDRITQYALAYLWATPS